jgi:molybdopterin synthase sulfur carrier subunit
MTITVRFFATYRQLTGKETLELQIDNTAATVTDVIEQLEQQYPQFSGRLRASALVAINEKYVHRRQELHPNDTIAFFPPVSGG